MSCVQDRVKANVKRGPKDYHDPQDKLALLYLFDFLADVEEIAVLAAKRGDAIADQLEDEIVHRDSFRQIARQFGPRSKTRPQTIALIKFLEELQGPSSLAILNVVAESWLENVFAHLAKTRVAPELFEVIQKEEERHSHEAREATLPDPEEVRPLLQEVEFLLADLMSAPCLLIPMVHLIGDKATCRIGLEGAKKHQVACEVLGVEPGYVIRDIKVACRAINMQGVAPSRVGMNKFEDSKQTLFNNQSVMEATQMVLMPYSSHSDIEAVVIKAIGRILSTKVTRAHVTVRGKELWQPHHVVVGVRRLYDEIGDLITTIFIQRPERKSVAEIRKYLSHRLCRVRKRPYHPLNESLDDLEPLMPPSRCSAIVSYVGSYGLRNPIAGPMTSFEGNAISLYIGEPHFAPWVNPVCRELKVKNQVQIGIQFDHRCGDGRELGQITTALREYFEWLDSKAGKPI